MPRYSPEEVCLHYDVVRREKGLTDADETCLGRMTSAQRLDGPELWSLRSTCMAEAPSYGAFITCNHEAHPDWPLPGAHRSGSSEGSTPTTAGPATRDSVGLRFGATLLILAIAIALAAWARDVGSRHPAPRFVHRLAIAFLAIPLADAVLAFRSFAASSGTGLDEASPIARVLSSAAPSLVALGSAALLMLALTWRYRWSARAPSDAGQPPYR